MKNSYNRIIIIFFLTSTTLMFVFQTIIPISNFFKNSTIEYLVYALIIAVVLSLYFKYILQSVAKKNNLYIATLENKCLVLAESNERYDIVSKATSDTIWDWDMKTNGFIWNRGIEGIFGYKATDVGNNLQWWFDKIHPEDSIKISVKLYSFIAEKSEKWKDEYRFRCADGSYKYVSNRGFLVKDENENVIRMIGAIQDVTKQKIEEQRLKLLETVITQTKDAVVITETDDTEENDIPKILFVNPAFTSMTGYTHEEVIGKTPTVFMGKNMGKIEIKKLAESLKKKEEFTFETLNYRKNNEEYWVYLSMIPITNKDNKHSHWISIQRDISVEKQREKEREQLISELTQNNKDLKQFSYITSHNLRAPLSNLTGLISLMQDIPIENEELKEILSGFSKSTEQLNETINDLVKVIIIKDSPSIEKEEVVLNEIIENVFNQLSFLINSNNPIINLEFNDAPTLITNKSYFESIILNLMTNSLKYKDKERRLKIKISSSIINGCTHINFSDNGIGIDLDRNKDKIFGLYQRFHDYPDSKGLGLYLVKSQVESMGGKIMVESEINKGTSYTIVFKNN